MVHSLSRACMWNLIHWLSSEKVEKLPNFSYLSSVQLFATPYSPYRPHGLYSPVAESDYTVSGILQARILEWVAFPFSGGSPQPRDRTRVSHMWAVSLPAEPQGKPKNTGVGSLSLLQGIFLTQELNPGLLICRQILYQLSQQGSPNMHWNRWLKIASIMQGAQPGSLGQPRGVGWGGRWEEGSRQRGHKYAYGWFTLLYGRSQHNIVNVV